MKHFKTAALLIAPPLLMGAFALYLGRAPKSKPVVVNGPFSVEIAGIEAQPVEAVNVYDGYDRRFEIVFGAQGRKPAWWGKDIGSWTGTRDSTWKFFLERDGITSPFAVPVATMETSRWNKESERYSNGVLLNVGDVPTDSALKVRGITRLSDNSTGLSPPLPFELTLKKAGEKWTKPVVSTDPGLVVRSINVKPFDLTHRKATIEVFSTEGFGEQGSTKPHGFVDGNWKRFSAFYGTGGRRKGAPTLIDHNFYREPAPNPNARLRKYSFTWKVADMKREPTRDVIAIPQLSMDGRWPLEIAFYAKQDGQQSLGEVTPLTRPK